MKLKKYNNVFMDINFILMLLYCVLSTLFPVFFLNKLIFALLISLITIRVLAERTMDTEIIAPFIITMIYLIGLFNAQFFPHEPVLLRQFFLAIFILFLIFYIKKNKIEMNSVVKKTGVVLTISTIFIYLIYFYIKDFPFRDLLLNSFNRLGSLSLGERGFSEKSLTMFHLGAVPFLFLPTCLYYKSYIENKEKKSLFYFGLLFFPVILSTSRALFLGIVVIVCYLNIKNKTGMKKISMLMLMMMLLFGAGYYLTENTTVFSSKDYGNSIKAGHIKSYFDILNLRRFLFGDGLASLYYSSGLKHVTAHTEVTIVDSFRYFGVPLTFILYYFIVFPTGKVIKLNKNNIDYFMIMGMYILMSFTNPILFNSFGLIVVLWYWSKITEREYV